MEILRYFDASIRSTRVSDAFIPLIVFAFSKIIDSSYTNT